MLVRSHRWYVVGVRVFVTIECVTVSRLRHRPTQSNTGTKALKRARKIQHARDVAYVAFFLSFSESIIVSLSPYRHFKKYTKTRTTLQVRSKDDQSTNASRETFGKTAQSSGVQRHGRTSHT